jgi:uncharacterized protein YeeX (DUF496 family)
MEQQTPDEEVETLSHAYAEVLEFLDVVRRNPTMRRDVLDLDASIDELIDIRGTAVVDLARALHEYGHLCLWVTG